MKSYVLPNDPIERFLADAERAARRGDRELALELIVLALDTAPGDPAILVRAHAIRAMLPTADQSFAQRQAPPAIETRLSPPDPAEPSSLHDDEASGLFLPLPSVEDLRLETPDAPDEDLVSLLQSAPTETTGPEVEVGPEGPEEDSWRPRRHSRSLVYVLWVFLVLGVLGAIVTAMNPAIIDGVASAIRRTYDPYARAEHFLAQRRYADVIDALSDRIGDLSPTQQISARLFLAEAYVETEDTTAAIRELQLALENDTSWRNAMTAARLLSRVAALQAAASAYLLAFERGAPLEQWTEIAAGLDSAGRTEQAQHIRQLLGRDVPADTGPPASSTDR